MGANGRCPRLLTLRLTTVVMVNQGVVPATNVAIVPVCGYRLPKYACAVLVTFYLATFWKDKKHIGVYGNLKRWSSLGKNYFHRALKALTILFALDSHDGNGLQREKSGSLPYLYEKSSKSMLLWLVLLSRIYFISSSWCFHVSGV